MTDLRLLAVDQDDLAVLSAHCQDAIVRVADCHWHRSEQQFALEMNRFVWEKAAHRGLMDRIMRRSTAERRRSVLHFNRVVNVRHLRLDRAAADEILVLLAVRFETTDAPSGTVELVFAGGGAIRLDVEVIEAQLTDIGGAWSTESTPDHTDAGA